MVIESLIGGSIAALSIYAAANWEMGDKKKIQHTFENIDYKVNEHTPKLVKTHKTESHTTYTYNVPYGLVDDPKLQVLEKVLNKPVKVSFTNQKLHIKVYNNKLNKSYPYNVFAPNNDWSIPVGMSQDGVIYHDFEQIPHMIVSGSTTWGKTVFMRMFMTHLIENNPDGVEFYILDLKGRLAFNKYRNLKQVKAVAGNHAESARVLKMVKRDIKRDIDYLLSIDAENAKEGNLNTRKFIIIDEAGELKPEKSMSEKDKEYARDCQSVMSYIARVAGQVGYKMIFGTQYPTKEILDPQIKANALGRVSFRLATAVQSGVAIDQNGAEKLEYKGRAIYKTVDEHLVQTPFISKEEIWERIGRYNNVSTTNKTQTERRKDIVEL
ncbi:FtsK/SpoIIIE domain-containing protein [Oceanobacillus profundus]|uniref:FtsK/SpoIIIE domain-containing protein n=1 Tax=Oceanobacillus profundus TaxID=372463 RepID=UPI0026E302DD|nr:FtsK/SpoIIIE domain-containing protein [Oceanobacillus profundus]MDO6451702.1 FtsK/SpoIIIE domain-containing protein [Oceanobacillus profundus]